VDYETNFYAFNVTILIPPSLEENLATHCRKSYAESRASDRGASERFQFYLVPNEGHPEAIAPILK